MQFNFVTCQEEELLHYLDEIKGHLSLSTEDFWLKISQNLPYYELLFRQYFIQAVPFEEQRKQIKSQGNTKTAFEELYEKSFFLYIRLIQGGLSNQGSTKNIPNASSTGKNSTTSQLLQKLTRMTLENEEENIMKQVFHQHNSISLPIDDSSFLAENSLRLTKLTDFTMMLDFVYLYFEYTSLTGIFESSIRKIWSNYADSYYEKIGPLLSYYLQSSPHWESCDKPSILYYLKIVRFFIEGPGNVYLSKWLYYQQDTLTFNAMLLPSNLTLINQTCMRLFELALHHIDPSEALKYSYKCYQSLYEAIKLNKAASQAWDHSRLLMAALGYLELLLDTILNNIASISLSIFQKFWNFETEIQLLRQRITDAATPEKVDQVVATWQQVQLTAAAIKGKQGNTSSVSMAVSSPTLTDPSVEQIKAILCIQDDYADDYIFQTLYESFNGNVDAAITYFLEHPESIQNNQASCSQRSSSQSKPSQIKLSMNSPKTSIMSSRVHKTSDDVPVSYANFKSHENDTPIDSKILKEKILKNVTAIYTQEESFLSEEDFPHNVPFTESGNEDTDELVSQEALKNPPTATPTSDGKPGRTDKTGNAVKYKKKHNRKDKAFRKHGV